MTHTLKPIEPKTEVVVIEEGKSLIDQILELPINSVVLLPGSGAAMFPHGTSTVLHRCGGNGWLITRGARELSGGDYLNRKALVDLLALRQDPEAIVLHEGSGVRNSVRR